VRLSHLGQGLRRRVDVVIVGHLRELRRELDQREDPLEALARVALLVDGIGQVDVASLDRLRPSPEWLKGMRRTIFGAWDLERATAHTGRARVEAERGRVEAQLRRLDHAYVFEQAIDRETYTARRDELRERRNLQDGGPPGN
jgi:hypothetical protein